jgi:hypothetical protein
MRRLLGRMFFAAIIVYFLYHDDLKSQDKELVIENDPNAQVMVGGFTLNSEGTVNIKAIGAGGKQEIKRITNFQIDPQNMFAYAWILDATKRELVWRMTINNSTGDWWDKWNRVFEDEVTLPAGKFEVYYSTVEPTYYGSENLGISDLWDKIFGRDNWWEDHSSTWKIELKDVDRVYSDSDLFKYQQAVKNSLIINLTRMGDSVNKSAGFTLLKPASLKVYAIGEGWDDEMYDYAYIIDAETRERIWEMKYRHTEHAGGAIKNRVSLETIDLSPGDYIVYYRSDDNHSYDSWNANPPYDPEFWGVTISGDGDDFDRSIVETFEEREGKIVVRLDKLGDYEDVSEGFTVVRPMKLRIYAVGEGRDGKMFDYGWIEEARTGRKVWEMEFRDTDEAGGDFKNRRYDRILHFEPGSYIVHFVTDDSHSYDNFNKKGPDDKEAWGIRIYTIGKKDDSNYVRRYNPERDKNIIVQLIRIGDDEHVRQKFTLLSDTDIRIYAIGEGDWDEMYDYAWIENYKTGKIVWKMKYKSTRRAGGNIKNRVFDGTILLRAGTYVAHYRTDDSHAFGSWNTDAPRDKSNWGITIYTYDNH